MKGLFGEAGIQGGVQHFIFTFQIVRITNIQKKIFIIYVMGQRAGGFFGWLWGVYNIKTGKAYSEVR